MSKDVGICECTSGTNRADTDEAGLFMRKHVAIRTNLEVFEGEYIE